MSSTASELSSPLQFIKGVGPHLAERLRQKDLYTLEDALYFVPRAYEDRENIKPIRDLEPGIRETSFGVIRKVSLAPMKLRRRHIFVLTIADQSGWIVAKWFRFNQRYMMSRFKIGMQVVFTGDIKIFRSQKEVIHPDIEIIEKPATQSLHFGRIVPIYSLTEGLYQKTIRKIMRQALDTALPTLKDPLPQEVKTRLGLWNLDQSFQEIHFPASQTSLGEILKGAHPARRRLVFDEFFFLELGLALRKKQRQEETAMAYPPSKNYLPNLLPTLPYRLTQAQERTLREIAQDLKLHRPMYRLLQGDVGSGKTIVAFLSSLSVLEQKHQVVLMAPTEILADQHFKTLKPWLDTLKIPSCILKSDLKKSDKSKLVQEIKTGFFPFIIGTHAVIQDGIEFKNLGYIIIDEQHRFGVKQRLDLKKKGENPHLLVMTATPIPRTLSLTLYGDLDISLLDELPLGRKPITTKVVRESQRLKLYQFMKDQLVKGRQAYVVYPLIEESEKIDLKNATEMTVHLKQIFSSYRVDMIHGQMPSEQKETLMKAFSTRQINILVSTTVIEVGIDVPNSTLMVVEHAQRFGLSQLHQLRGRVGRGAEKSYCFLMADLRLSELAQERLKVMETTQDGFKIAEADLKLRGPGEFLGIRQSGLAQFRIAQLVTDTPLLLQARQEAFDLISKDPDLKAPSHQPLKASLEHHWKQKFDLIESG